MFWGYAATKCIIDNTNLARLRGAGSQAVIVPEMDAFSKRYGFQFVCHALDHPNRKAGNERSFWSVETSFLPGRTFESLEDLNQQARQWATERMEHRVLTKARVIPAQLFEHERLYLNPLPEHLPRNIIHIEPDEDTTGMKYIGEEFTEELEITPPSLYVNRYVRPKYARSDNAGVVIGMLPVRPIEKGMAGPSLLAHLAVSKYVDHLPLYRQRKQFLRYGVQLPASTLGDWVCATCELLTPIYELHRHLIQNAGYLMADETPIRVQDKNKKGKCHRGYYWVYYDPLKPAVLFEYQETRARAGPEGMLADFSGYLQTDGYQGYDGLGERDSIIHAGCFAHARRYFTDAFENDASRAEWMLLRIQKLYKVEREAREAALTHEQRYTLRQERAAPVLDEIKIWLDEQRDRILPKNNIGKAVAYMLKYWQRLIVYTTNGILEIDNNLVENAIRPVALGRKNYLFAGSHDGARRAAIIYSLVATAQLYGHEPFDYLKDVIARLPEHPHKRLFELLPNNWTPPDIKEQNPQCN